MRSRRRRETKVAKRQNYWYVLLFIVGFLIMFYPVFSNFYYQVKQDDSIANFNNERKAIEKAEIEKRIELARAYNKTLDPGRLNDPYTDLEKKGVAEYARMLELNEQIGYVEIPTIDVKLSLYAGTSSDVLERGAGHLEGSSLPVGGESTHTVITAHTGIPKAKLFTDLIEVKKNDIFYIHNIKETLAYQVDNIVVVEPDDFSHVLVSEGKDYATLLTCTPYGVNTHRLLVRGHRIPYHKPKKVTSRSSFERWYYLFAIVILILLALILVYKRRTSKKKRYGG